MWFLLALIALVCWSGSDLFSKIGSKPDDKFSQWKMVVAVGLVMGIHAGIEIVFFKVPFSLEAMWTYLPASLCYISSMFIGYIGLRYIELSISSPICNTSGAFASLFLIIFFADRAGIESQTQLVMTIVGIIVCALGVTGLGFAEMSEDDEIRARRQETANVKYSKSWLALAIPIIYCFIDAAGTVADSFILDVLDEDVANVAYELTFLLCGIVAAIYAFAIKKDKPTVKREAPKLIGAISETVGQFAYISAIAANTVAAAPIISCYCVLSVVWSAIFLKERLSWKHYAAIAITVVGIAVLGIFGGE
ncbi:MAG: GRP family sugar transporter [Clostridia bacterium]|nr:GRP family sugar transporter [Clostridiales bacterium]MDD7165396.1 GRP family sugar transporter [Clostridia bacterium]MDY2901197.1 GRP family sugar transporter [Christensenellaceae bacterium]